MGAAALYNLVWGGWAVFFPLSVFAVTRLPAPNYPEVWQGTGMLLALYGVGFAVAATDPIRHWPIVLIGLMGKFLAPAGFVWSASRGRLPWSAGWVFLINDVIWWVPFGMILKVAFDSHQARMRNLAPEVLPLALRQKLSTGVSIETLSKTSPVLMVFLRHTGCTFCREALADISRQRHAIEASGTQVVLVHMSEAHAGKAHLERYGLADVPQISDPQRNLYRAFGLRRGDVRMLFGPKTWWRGIHAGLIQGHGAGPLAGDGFQMPGIFLVFHGRIVRCYRHQSAADRPDYARFAAATVPAPVS